MDRLELMILALGAAAALRIAMHFVDKARIGREVEAQGGRVVSISWDPFGRGWFFEKNERHYTVIYTDRAGATKTAACKTSWFSGVYWAEPPATEEAAPRFFARHRCAKCGYALSAEWRACPNCGKATGLA